MPLSPAVGTLVIVDRLCLLRICSQKMDEWLDRTRPAEISSPVAVSAFPGQKQYLHTVLAICECGISSCSRTSWEVQLGGLSFVPPPFLPEQWNQGKRVRFAAAPAELWCEQALSSPASILSPFKRIKIHFNNKTSK
ncbi:uncharacterized protein ACIB01_011009 [Guaruba guarouba]